MVSLAEASMRILTLNQRPFFDNAVSITEKNNFLDSDIMIQSFYNISPKISEDFGDSCSKPTPDGPGFIDCVVSRARSIVRSGLASSFHHIPLIFEIEVLKYMESSSCDDVPHSLMSNEGLSCADLLSVHKNHSSASSQVMNQIMQKHIDRDTDDINHGNLCHFLEINGYCRLSCLSCGNHMSEHQKTDIPVSQSERESHLQSSIKATNDTDVSIPLLISSDWHVEPWYEASCDDTVARYSNASCDNMWQCFDEVSGPIACYLNGISDPPIDFIESHFISYQQHLSDEAAFTKQLSHRRNDIDFKNVVMSLPLPGILFYAGDTQAHSYSSPNIGSCGEQGAINLLMTAVLSLMNKYWDSSDIFLCPGNNDGPHNSIFSSSDDPVIAQDTLAWANAVLDAQIVNNDLGFTYEYPETISFNASDPQLLSWTSVSLSQTEFFSSTGYYIKALDPFNNYGLNATLFVLCYNTNLGLTNFVQRTALLTDLERISALGGGVYVLGHHPGITTQLIPQEYSYLVKGLFSGHIHIAASTTSTLFTQVSAISQAATDTAFYTSKISASDNYEIRVDRTDDLISYKNRDGKGKLSDPSLWQ